jgi:hypothetical protein
MLERDVVVIAGLGAIALLAVALFWKEFKLLSFDPEYGATQGLPMRAIDVLLTTFLVIAIVIGLQTVGVVLMSAMVVAPAAAARQWTNSLGVMVVLAGAFGALAGVSGAVISGAARTCRRADHRARATARAALDGVRAGARPGLGGVQRGGSGSRSARTRCSATCTRWPAARGEHAHDVGVLEAMRAGRARTCPARWTCWSARAGPARRATAAGSSRRGGPTRRAVEGKADEGRDEH